LRIGDGHGVVHKGFGHSNSMLRFGAPQFSSVGVKSSIRSYRLLFATFLERQVVA
jgi:hypothetical protein